ncbi:ATP synthase F1 subunit gamma [bacterium CG06_land_8_20_14_3_00_33_50]|nr:MAG: ATP synthase F1 subunit gamma [bacterium CG2_30_33_46]PIR67895.1 MAG: ATP synthase F1 subunit gamma [bacterium CG10_big_fil_rev_8_21_14_0_10_33_18]PIU76316.1 MAG: ATP synthase F1 subunit gamma [bacterium CG06_land_8_20_14_3_00_33_50]PIW81008.1 MAG: ATP synthase F1 subunit gamma [bacterium CG_4_8_14_3_um_filter_33_28]PIY85470.1 MAG: ATP synthase F1 subunit gamma [bacterium CG_4_10_14_0_8_um_filter_33_57]PJA72297.1 MAG: ATP synthase F1 subunit gamma [bacterium CG_4_9_14_3_um_filter_33_26
MAGAKEIRRRIKSVSNTKQIIKAMELVSVVKMQRAVSNNLASRSYSKSADEILSNLCEGINLSDHPFLLPREGKRKLVILVTSDRGLCGGLNMKAIKKALDESKDCNEVGFITIGRKGRDFLKSYGYKIIAEFTKIDDHPNFSQIMPIINVVTGDFLADRYDQAVLVYSHFQSTLMQEPTVLNLLPFSGPNVCNSGQDKITFEPDKDKILDSLMPRMLEIKVWQSFLESIASEHSARMVAMKNANENAEELISDLTLTFNQTRQAGITKEIAEISAGKMTLEE